MKEKMTVDSLPLVSVVTPLYNTEKYLAECIESVLAQTYQNWEYIIVNNCSTDRSLDIAQRYAEQDSRIRLHNNDIFLSAIQNWNHSLRQISTASKYCKVVHADDWLFPECITRMVELAEANPTVGIVGAYRLEENEVGLDGLSYASNVVSGREICRSTLLGGPYVFGSPTSLLIRADFIRRREAFYNEQNIHADKEACFGILGEADFGFVHQVLTYTRRHNEAMTSFTRRVNTFEVGRLETLKKYGPVYLSQNEYERRLKQAVEDYYKVFLARSVFEFKGKEFWDYQKKELERLALPFSGVKLLQASLLQLLNLTQTYRIIKSSLQKKKTAQAPKDNKRPDIIVSQRV
jgi:glycosyltransferase involved in cell wall biosynthesis